MAKNNASVDKKSKKPNYVKVKDNKYDRWDRGGENIFFVDDKSNKKKG